MTNRWLDSPQRETQRRGSRNCGNGGGQEVCSHLYHSNLPFGQFVGHVGTGPLPSIVWEPMPDFQSRTNFRTTVRVLCGLVGRGG